MPFFDVADHILDIAEGLLEELEFVEFFSDRAELLGVDGRFLSGEVHADVTDELLEELFEFFKVFGEFDGFFEAFAEFFEAKNDAAVGFEAFGIGDVAEDESGADVGSVDGVREKSVTGSEAGFFKILKFGVELTSFGGEFFLSSADAFIGVGDVIVAGFGEIDDIEEAGELFEFGFVFEGLDEAVVLLLSTGVA